VPKWLKVLTGIVVFLAAIWAATRLAGPRKERFSAGVPSQIAKVEIRGPGREAVILERSGDEWFLKAPREAAADEGIIRDLLKSARSLELAERLTQREESHGRYHVTESSAIALRFFEDGTADPVVLLFGKSAPDYSHVYVRLPPGPAVYLASGLGRSDLERTPDQWRDRRVLRLAADETVAGLKVSGKASYELSKTSDAWTVNGRPADADKAAQAAAQAAEMTAMAFVDAPSSVELKRAGLAPPLRTLVFSTSRGRALEVKVGKKDESDGTYAVQPPGAEGYVTVSSYILDSLPDGPGHFLPAAPVSSVP
jgi:hypothetical protein